MLIDGVFPIFCLYTVYIDSAATTKRPLLSPGTAHNHRAATERSPEILADEIGCAARRGGRSGWRWRPSMMNGGGGASPLSTIKMGADHCPNRNKKCPPAHCFFSAQNEIFSIGALHRNHTIVLKNSNVKKISCMYDSYVDLRC
jgi:hypothetical protein